MKKMTCNQLGGACPVEFEAETFEEIAAMSRAHGMEMFKQGDQGHLDAMEAMKSRMQAPGAIEKWYEERRAEFDAMP